MTYGRAVIAGALALVGALLPAAVGWAQITHDGSLRPAGPPLTGPNFVIDSARGRIEGNKNLFHSFGQFNVGEGGSATFTGPPSIANVISRVTGGQLSSIDGLIDTRTFMPNASFFLLNPAGIMLGPSASLNVGGAFHLSTADYLCLGSGGCLLDPAAGKFFSKVGGGDVFTVAPPAAFGFFGPPTGSIVVDRSQLFSDPSLAQTISLVGGPIQVTEASLSAPGGRVQLVSVNSLGEVPLDLQGFSGRGSITVTRSTIDVSGDPGGSVVIRGGNLVIDATNIIAVTGAVDGAPVGIELSAAGSLSITNSSDLGLIAATTGDGRGGGISLSGNSVEITNGATVRTVRAGNGAGGDISLTGETLTMTGGSGVLSDNLAEGTARSGNISATVTGSMRLAELSALKSTGDQGDGAQVSVSAGSLTLESGAVIQSISLLGRGGDVVVTAPQLTLRSSAQISSEAQVSGRGGDVRVVSTGAALIEDPFTRIATSSSFFDPEAPGLGLPGNISTSFGSLTLTGGATIQSGVFAGSQGGSVSLVATGPVVISNGGGIASEAFHNDVGNITISAPQIIINNGFISTSTLQSGRAGDISIAAGTLTLENGGQIASASIAEALGRGGDVHLNVGSLTISGRSPTGGSVLPFPFSDFFKEARSGIYSTTAGSAPGGNITIGAAQIQLLDGGTISAAASIGEVPGSGPAGHIDVSATGSITITGASPTGQSGLFSTTAGTGPGGNITLRAAQIQLADGGTISAASTGKDPGSGAAGNIDVTAAESVTITGTSPTGQSGLFSTTAGTGPGGNITLRAPQIRLADGGTISASSTGGPSATAGSIDITFGEQFVLDHASISTDSLQADGGNITIVSTGSILHLIDSQITTSVRSGVGGGGNITLGASGHPLQFLVLDNGGIHADAFGGPGGNINIFADVMLSSTPIETAVTASSALSAPGTVNISAVVTDISEGLATLSTEVLQAAALLRASCATRLAEGKTSSLVVAGREGVPLEPGGLVPSGLMEPRRAAVAGRAASFLADEWPRLRLSYLDAACGR